MIDDIGLTAPAYQRADIRLQSNVELHEAAVHQFAGLVSRIVELEGPIHSDEVARHLDFVIEDFASAVPGCYGLHQNLRVATVARVCECPKPYNLLRTRVLTPTLAISPPRPMKIISTGRRDWFLP